MVKNPDSPIPEDHRNADAGSNNFVFKEPALFTVIISKDAALSLTGLAIETTASSANTLKIRLADSLNVDSIVSPELGRLLSVRVRKQNTIVINLPTTVIKGYRLELVVTCSGPIESQEIDREAVAVSAPQIQDQPPEEVVSTHSLNGLLFRIWKWQ